MPLYWIQTVSRTIAYDLADAFSAQVFVPWYNVLRMKICARLPTMNDEHLS